MHIKDRTFIVSGGASGLGLATVRDLHAHGGYVSYQLPHSQANSPAKTKQVAILDVNAEVGNKTVKELGGRIKFWETDMTNTESIEAG